MKHWLTTSVILALLLLVGVVSADSDYCDPSAGVNTSIESAGTWSNITITSDTCPVCVQTIVGWECSVCPIRASFTVDKVFDIISVTVQFNSTTAGNVSIWNLSFGDGWWYNTTGIFVNQSHTYLILGNYSSYLIAGNTEKFNTSEITWINLTHPTEILMYDGATPINDLLQTKQTFDEIADTIAVQVWLVISNLSYPYSYTSGNTNITIKSIYQDLENARVGYAIAATRDGQNINTRSPIWVYNSPFMVIKSRTYDNKTNIFNTTEKEDPQTAVEQVLLKYVDKQPFGEAEGDDTLIVYTLGGTTDGWTYNQNGGTEDVFATQHDYPTGYDFTTGNLMYSSITAGTTETPPKFLHVERVFLGFNTSTLPDVCTIDSATVTVWAWSKTGTLGTALWGLTMYAPATNGTFVAGDYDNYNNAPGASTRLATDIPYASIATGDHMNNWTLNSNGLEAISKTHYTNIMVREASDVDDVFGGAWSLLGVSSVAFVSSRYAPESPSITISYTEGGACTPPTVAIEQNQTSGLFVLPVAFNTTNTTDSIIDMWNWLIIENGVKRWQNITDIALRNISTTFSTGGNHTIVLYVNNTCSGFGIVNNTTYVDIWNRTNASFTGTPVTGESPLAVTFTDLSSNATDYNWSLGDGNYSTLAAPSHNYEVCTPPFSRYTVIQNASNAYDYNISTMTDYINVTCVAVDTIPPESISGLNNVSADCDSITWMWTDPPDTDLDHVLVYINDTLTSNVTAGVQIYTANGLPNNTVNNLSALTEDTSGNLNTTWVNNSALTTTFCPPAPPLSGGGSSYTTGAASNNDLYVWVGVSVCFLPVVGYVISKRKNGNYR